VKEVDITGNSDIEGLLDFLGHDNCNLWRVVAVQPLQKWKK